MSKKEDRKIIGERATQPEFYKKFKCTEDKCINNCCQHNWEINIDKETYKEYKKLPKPESDRLCKNIEVISKNPFKSKIKMDKDGKCSLLRADGLCSVHLKYGSDFLSNTCRIYPRFACVVGGKLEAFLSLSCEAVADLVLFEKDPVKMEPSILAHNGKGQVVYGYALSLDKYTKAKNALDIFRALRRASLAIVGDRSYSVRLRMLILCLFSQEVEEYLISGRDLELLTLCDEYVNRLGSGYFAELSRELPGGADISTDIVLSILREMFDKKKDEQLKKCIRNVLNGHRISADTWSIPDNFAEGYRADYDKHFSDKEYITENYLSNCILSEGFPFTYKNDGDGSVFMNYAALSAKFDIIEFLIVGICNYKKKFDRRAVVDAVSIFSRVYEHNTRGYLDYSGGQS